MRGEWIEILPGSAPVLPYPASLPMRGERIEILNDIDIGAGADVSHHAGRVDYGGEGDIMLPPEAISYNI